MRCVKIKTVVLLFVFFLPVTFCNVFCAVTKDGHSHINVYEHIDPHDDKNQ